MIKKIMFIFCYIFLSLQDQDANEIRIDLAYQELVYDFGMLLIEHESIIDSQTAKIALVDVYNNLPQVHQILDLIMIIDEELCESNITNIEDLIDFEINVHEDIVQASILWLAAYQNVFEIFVDIHGPDASFVDWCYDIVFLESLQGDEDLQDPAYEKLWQACCDAMQAQKAFEDVWSEIE